MNLNDSNLVISLLEADTTCLHSYRSLLFLIQKSHYKSTNLHKLHIALDVYRGLANIPTIRKDVIAKVASMLLHPFPKVRVLS